MMPEMCPGGFENEQQNVNIYFGDSLAGTMRVPATMAQIEVCEATETYSSRAPSPTAGDFTFRLVLTKGARRKMFLVCKNKKRFIKLMMSRGMSRKMANELAQMPERMGGKLSFQHWYITLHSVEGKFGGLYEL